MKSYSKRTKTAAATVILLVVLTAVGLMRRETYFLNKAVRLIGIRISQFEHLSYVRGQPYKISFYESNYTIFAWDGEKWSVFAEYQYPSRIRSSLDDIHIVLRNGRVDSRTWKNRELRPQTPVTLYLQKEGKEGKKGILFLDKGTWRILS
ncbi:hypothetical protein ACFLT9_13000 [Acidobacteriota bacterium]